jgi:hypothetical protein
MLQAASKSRRRGDAEARMSAMGGPQTSRLTMKSASSISKS